MITRDIALERLKKYVASDSLIKHCLAVEGSMRHYAEIFEEDVERWGLVGLLHDIDYEKYPDEHPLHAREFLDGLELDEEMIEAIIAHGKQDGIVRETKLAKTLAAVDGLSSFIIAYVHVRPDKSFVGIKLKSIKKKFKDKAFARAVNRQWVTEDVEDLGIELAEHMQNVIDGIVAWQATLGEMGVSLV